MGSHLRDFSWTDFPLIRRWQNQGDSSDFMSRTMPHAWTEDFRVENLVRWHIILVDDREVGTIWIERDSIDSQIGDLGIWIFEPTHRGHGFGRNAIRLAEQDTFSHWKIARIQLRVRKANFRAVSCYLACGYTITSTTDKMVDGGLIQVLHMEHLLCQIS